MSFAIDRLRLGEAFKTPFKQDRSMHGLLPCHDAQVMKCLQ